MQGINRVRPLVKQIGYEYETANIIYKLNMALVSKQLQDNAQKENIFKPFFIVPLQSTF
jgi:hypothetical protein